MTHYDPEAISDLEAGLPTAESHLQAVDRAAWGHVRSDSFSYNDYPLPLDGMSVEIPNLGTTKASRILFDVAPERVPNTWQMIMGQVATTPSALDDGAYLEAFTKINSENTHFIVRPRNARIDAPDVLFVGTSPMSRTVRGNLEGNQLSSSAVLEVSGNIRQFFESVLAETALAVDQRKAKAEAIANEPLKLYDPQERRSLAFSEITWGNLSTPHNRRPLLLLMDFSVEVPDVSLAVAGPLSSGYQVIALCPLESDGTYNGGWIIEDRDPNPARTIVEIGEYDPTRPVPLDELIEKTGMSFLVPGTNTGGNHV